MRIQELLLAIALATGCTGRAYVVEDTPPPLREEVVVYRPGYVWIHGNWARDGRRWAWRGGHFERERPNHVYVQGRWERRGPHFVWIEGGWRARVSRR
jgi:hypothetical protein